jgi:hypothetical protein
MKGLYYMYKYLLGAAALWLGYKFLKSSAPTAVTMPADSTITVAIPEMQLTSTSPLLSNPVIDTETKVALAGLAQLGACSHC